MFTWLPINLRDSQGMLWAGQAAADRIGDALRHGRHLKAPVEAEAEAAEVPSGVLVKVEGVEGS